MISIEHLTSKHYHMNLFWNLYKLLGVGHSVLKYIQ